MRGIVGGYANSNDDMAFRIAPLQPWHGKFRIHVDMCCFAQGGTAPEPVGLPELKSFSSLAQLYKRYGKGVPALGQRSFQDLEDESLQRQHDGTGKKGDWRAGASRNHWYAFDLPKL